MAFHTANCVGALMRRKAIERGEASVEDYGSDSGSQQREEELHVFPVLLMWQTVEHFS